LAYAGPSPCGVHPPGSFTTRTVVSQYCSVEYQAELRKNGISISMSGTGNCFDNAMIETFFKTLKAELVWRTIFQKPDRSREHNRPLHRRLLQLLPPPFGARLHQPASVRRAGSVKSKTLSINACQVHLGDDDIAGARQQKSRKRVYMVNEGRGRRLDRSSRCVAMDSRKGGADRQRGCCLGGASCMAK
jgi:hypothetical protein